ncbi:MAG: MBL fold metallo-hydrolase [Planctomycetota bacterium]|jgi:ribonuclease Z
MIPKQPPRDGQSGFLYLPPYRIHGISVAGEHTTITVPELGVTFDMGQCTRASLSSDLIALSHSHMDHVGAIPYWFSQRFFQKLEGGRVLCHPDGVEPLRRMLASWVDVERQKTPHEIVAIEPDSDVPIRQNIGLRAIETHHTCPSLGFSIIETRHKLKAEYRDLPQSELRRLKADGDELTTNTEIPLIAYTGDTDRGEFLERDEFAKAKIVVAECTFIDADHRSRARIGRHLHLEDIAELLSIWEAEHVVLVHLSRRTLLSEARERIATLGADADRIHLLMDHRTNRRRYESQLEAVAVPDSEPESS